jgi:hypothetical protein
MSTDPMAVYAMLCRAADSGSMCPTNLEIRTRFGLRSGAAAVRLVRVLEQRGLISVQRFHMSRVVTIIQSGRSTAEPATQTRHWRQREKTDAEAVREMIKAAAALPEPEIQRLKPKGRPANIIRATMLQARMLNKEAARPLATNPGFSGPALSGGCRFIAGEDYLETILAGGNPYCCKPVAEAGSSWCGEHRAIVFTKKSEAETFG